MGHCSYCGKRIEYNRFEIVDGKIYCTGPGSCKGLRLFLNERLKEKRRAPRRKKKFEVKKEEAENSEL